MTQVYDILLCKIYTTAWFSQGMLFDLTSKLLYKEEQTIKNYSLPVRIANFDPLYNIIQGSCFIWKRWTISEDGEVIKKIFSEVQHGGHLRSSHE